MARYGRQIPQDEMVLGLRGPSSSFNKFGYRTSTTAAGGDEVIWESTDTFTPMTTADTFNITYTNTSDGSGQIGALVLLIDYIDENFDLQQATHVLGGTGTDTTVFSGLGINRAVVVSSGTNDANVAEIKMVDTTGGGTQAVIPAGTSVTQQLIFHMPVGFDGILKYIKIDTNKLSGGGTPIVIFKLNIYNRLVDTNYQIRRYVADTSITTDITEDDRVGIILSGRDVVTITMDTDTNGTEANGSFGLNIYESV
jgi:hypothetical protein